MVRRKKDALANWLTDWPKLSWTALWENKEKLRVDQLLYQRRGVDHSWQQQLGVTAQVWIAWTRLTDKMHFNTVFDIIWVWRILRRINAAKRRPPTLDSPAHLKWEHGRGVPKFIPREHCAFREPTAKQEQQAPCPKSMSGWSSRHWLSRTGSRSYRLSTWTRSERRKHFGTDQGQLDTNCEKNPD